MEENKIAILIDGENISQYDIPYIFPEIKKDGQILINRLYCGTDYIDRWKDTCNDYSIKIVTQNNYVTGKNTTDFSLIIDAMDMLYTREVDTFYILSSDSDFTSIIMRIREGNKKVVGVGEKNKTPKPIINACNKFIFIDNLKLDESKEINNLEVKEDNESEAKAVTNLDDIKNEIIDIVSEGRIPVSRIKDKLINMHPEFDLRNYGKGKKFTKFMEEISNVVLILDDDKTTWFAELKDIPQKSEENKLEKKNDKEIPTLDEIKEYIIELINKTKGKKINIGQLYASIKKKYSNFLLRNYGVSKIGKFIALYDDTFKYDNDKKPNFLLLNK